MTERVQSSGDGFPEKVCQLLVARDTQDISINGKRIHVLKEKISKIAFIGDSGCISPDGQTVCNDDTWPLMENLKSLSTHKQDLIAHLGDYQYREIAKCYPEQLRRKCAECVKKADTFHAWQEEWLNPSTEILKDFPMLFIRGNHENYDYCSEQYCNSSYKAWYRYFDINPYIPHGEVNIKKEDNTALLHSTLYSREATKIHATISNVGIPISVNLFSK